RLSSPLEAARRARPAPPSYTRSRKEADRQRRPPSGDRRIWRSRWSIRSSALILHLVVAAHENGKHSSVSSEFADWLAVEAYKTRGPVACPLSHQGVPVLITVAPLSKRDGPVFSGLEHRRNAG